MERGFTLWLTGLSGSGKTTLAHVIERALRERGCRTEILDGDVVRTHLSRGLGFSREDRDTHILRIGFVCQVLSRNGVVAIASVISPYQQTRDQVRAQIGDFVEVFVDTPLEECQRRDVKGLYRRALAGELTAFTGVSDPYEPPLTAEITVHTTGQTPEQSAATVLRWLESRGYLEPAPSHLTSVRVPVAVPVIHNGHAPHNGYESAIGDGAAYSAEEEAEVSARLEDLGYL